MISTKYKFIAFHVPKAAGSSVLGALKKSTGAPCNQDDPAASAFLKTNNVQWPNHAPSPLVKKYLGAKTYDEYFKFAFVRNPWDRLVSIYFYNKQVAPKRLQKLGIPISSHMRKIMESESFPEWVKGTHNLGATQASLLVEENKLDIDYIGRFEHIQSDFSHICGRIGIDNIQLPHSNKSKHRDYREYYDKSSISLVRKHFLEDIILFRYDFDKAPPSGTAGPKAWGRASALSYQGLNQWCRLGEIGHDGLTIHPNNPGEEKPLLMYHDIDLSGVLSLQTSAIAMNPNEANPGAVLEVSILRNSAVITSQQVTLLPQQDSAITVSLPEPLPKGDLRISTWLPDHVTSNSYSGVGLSKLKKIMK